MPSIGGKNLQVRRFSVQRVYALELPPDTCSKSMFLAGPTPRDAAVLSWRKEALQVLEDAGYDGVVFIPEPRDGIWKNDNNAQIKWEELCLHRADCILFWIPRDLETLPGFTTNVEFGAWMDSGKIVFGAPVGAPKNSYLLHYACELKARITTNLIDTIDAALYTIGDGAERTGGELEVPLYIWRTLHFQNWYESLVLAGNRLDGARVLWTFRVGPARSIVFFWVLHVDVYIASEDRHKTNEVVLARPDISTIVMYRRQEPIEESDIVLISEFRSPVSTPSGFVWEVPGGSSFKPGGDPRALAAAECGEETGLALDASRLRWHQARQMVATLSAHKAHLFSVEITDLELEALRADTGNPHGVVEDTERTYVHVVKLRHILSDNIVDWSMLGMILSVLTKQTTTSH